MKFKVSLLLVLVVLLMTSVNAGADEYAFQSPVPAATPDPGDAGDNGNEGGTVEFPDVDFDPTVLAVILGLVQYFKSLGVTGKGSLVLSMVLGVTVGGSAWIASTGTPVDFVGWFSAALVGLAYGLTASGLYDLSKLYRPS